MMKLEGFEHTPTLFGTIIKDFNIPKLIIKSNSFQHQILDYY